MIGLKEKFLRSSVRDERGQTLVFVALALTVLLGFMALATDVGVLFHVKRNLQIAADAAAVAGALDYEYNGSKTSAQAVAETAATANGFTSGVNGASVTINEPPNAGAVAGSNGYVEAIVTQATPTIFMGMFNHSSVTVAARAVAGGSTNSGCVWALGTSGTDIPITGSGSISIPTCDVFDNSDSSDALTLTGSGSLTAKAIGIVGGYNETGSGRISPKPVTGTAPAADPLSSLPAPPIPSSTGTTGSGCKNYTGQTLTPGCWNNVSFTGSKNNSIPAGNYVFNGGLSNTGSGSLTLGAGNYTINGGLNNNGSGSLTLDAGDYVINGGLSNSGGTVTLNSGDYIINGGLSTTGSGAMTLDAGDYTINGNFSDTGSGSLTLGAGLYIVTGNLSLTGSGALDGTGVTFYTEGSTSVTGSSSVDLTAPTSGNYDGVLFFQSRSDSDPISITGSSNMMLEGIIYAPEATLSFTGSGSTKIYTDLVVDSVSFTGSTSFQDYAALNTTSVLALGKLSLVE